MGSQQKKKQVQSFDLEDLQERLSDLATDNSLEEMMALLGDTKKSKMSSEDKTVLNIAAILVPFISVASKASNPEIERLRVAVDKNAINIRKNVYALEKLEQYTRRDNLRLFNFPDCTEEALLEKFIDFAKVLDVEVKVADISAIHRLPNQPGAIIVRFNRRKPRGDILFAKKITLRSDQCPFKGVYVQEDLTMQRSKLLRYIKKDDNTAKAQTREGKIRVTLKADRGAGKNVLVESPDDLFKLGLEMTDLTQFGYGDL